jgi:5,10-methylene-tetrahydrofolate dehydrogenase/methenyl tetrahydrofolate cyclohydrolase
MPRMGSPSDPASSGQKQAVIVGGCGFLGQSLASLIIQKGGYSVTLCDIAPCKNEELMKVKVDVGVCVTYVVCLL